MDNESLWPSDLFEEELRAPATILKEQASFLTKASRAIIRGKVYTDWDPSPYARTIKHLFRLEVPKLGDYAFDLIALSHDPHALYPVSIEYQLAEREEEAHQLASDEEELKRILEGIFINPKTKSVIRTLKAQAADPSLRPPEQAAESSADEDDIPF